MKRVATAFLVLALLAVLPTLALGQMGGGMMGGSTGSGQTGGMMGGATGSTNMGGTNSGGMGTGSMSNGAMSGMGAMGGMSGMGMMDELTIGPDGTAYVVDLDSSNTSAMKTTVTAISPLTSLASQWKVSLAGIAHAFAAGTDRLVLSVLPQTTTTQTTVKSKLYILNVTSGAQAFALDHDGVATSLKVVKVNGVDFAYLVTHDPVAAQTTATTPTTKLTIYRLDTGAVVKGVTLANDVDVLTQQE